jgi:hypothetical protein
VNDKQIYLVVEPDYYGVLNVAAFSTRELAVAFVRSVPEDEVDRVVIQEVIFDPTGDAAPGCFGVQYSGGEATRTYWSWIATPGTVYEYRPSPYRRGYGCEVYARTPGAALTLATATYERLLATEGA